MPRSQGVSEEQVERMIAAYAEGETCTAIAAREGIHGATVAKKLKAAGVKVKLGTPKGQRREFSDEEISLMVKLSREGISRYEIGRRLRSSQPVIHRVLAGLGEQPNIGGARGEDHGWWKGGRVVGDQGYVLVLVHPHDPMASMRMRNGYVPEHRLVMARHLGRPLTRHETVHHRDGVRDHNAIENLELRRGAHGKHQAMMCLDCGSHNVGPAV